MSKDPKKKKPTPKPKPKPQKTPSSQFAEVRASQNSGTTEMRPEALRSNFAGSITQAEYDYKSSHRPAQSRDVFGRKPQHWGASRMPGAPKGGGSKLTPLPPLTQPTLKRTASSIGKAGNYDDNMFKGAMAMYKKNKEKRRTDPVLIYRRRLWDMQMAKVGLTPEGNQLGGLRSIMIQRMNQLRGGG